MVDKSTAGEAADAPTVAPPQRTPHRHADPREAVAELTERAQQISREAGGKVAAAMKDVVSAAAGITGFAIESARDLVQFMVRRGQMTQDEADRLLHDVESAHAKRPAAERERPTATKIAAERAAAAKAEAAARAAAPPALPARAAKPNIAPASPTKNDHPAPAKTAKPAAKATRSAPAKAAKPAAKKAPAKSAPKKTKAPAKPAKPVKKPAAKKR